MNEPFCSNCGGNLTFVQQYNRWYCQRCAVYLESAPQPTQQQTQYRQQMSSNQEQSMVYVQGEQPYQQQQIKPGYGKICKLCGTVNETWSVTCKSCRKAIC